MYVCVCSAVTDKQIKKACEEGAGSMRELRMQLGVSGCCGQCAPAAHAILKQHQDEQRQRRETAEESALAQLSTPALAPTG